MEPQKEYAEVLINWDRVMPEPMLPSQDELLKSFCYWYKNDVKNIPLRHLYTYPNAGATTLWKVVSETFDDVVLMGATKRMVTYHNFDCKYSFSEFCNDTSFEGLIYVGITPKANMLHVFENKVLIIDGYYASPFLKTNKPFILNKSIKGLLLS